MLSRTFSIWLGGTLLVLVLGSPVGAQHYQPFIEPGYFNHDLQFFAPASDIDTYGDDPVLRSGWFGTYNRMYIGVSRPDVVPSDDLMDLTWGNRWDVGYMQEDPDGWLFSFMHIDGPNVADIVRQQRLNRVNEDDEGLPAPDDDGVIDFGDAVNPPSDRNTSGPNNRERYYDIVNSLNGAKLNSVEVNKLYRVQPLWHGGILEPFFGFRYTKFEDIHIAQDYFMYDADGFQPAYPPFPPIIGIIPPPIDFRDTEIEDLWSDAFHFQNQMIGGQLGMRWSRRTSRWNLSSEFRAMAFQNFQHLRRTFNVERTYYDGQGIGSEVDGILKYQATQDWNTTETVVGTDIRAEAAYELTRDISLSVGMQFLGFFTGIGRGVNIDENSEEVVMVGTTFGIVINR